MTASRVLLSSSLILLASCASQPTPPQPLLVEKQSQCPVTLDVGQAITLALPSNPSTGYRWLLQNPANGVLAALGPEVYSNPEDTGLVGSAGRSLWRFKASASGSGHLLLVYQQPWAPEVKPAMSFDCDIQVR
ncbi:MULTISPECIES: protease inhibitor I42 family protein [Pseudomonas]|uniref:Inhibitor of cysteine peptidase n=2 Tax=Pseudomonas TaxID=286 RepID=A0A9X8EIN3_PSEPU|nr:MULTISPECIES: protease inhibitor I42 family protein [Pseudomonas]KIU50979.1 peptidase inhibitor I42 [Pseudomonas putida]KTC23486.1 peptidase inhibitor I42 [Pseudomonas putida]MBG8562077.1 protease inhibitor I42 family protein [Pseudomonas qingdaonensis]MCO7504711.1 protease inhibitor I42 family protein [Pseudomonas sp. VE 267-6A]MCO7529416.1 protease inhibitor I42 family protein [Pseudomonas sp. 2]